MMVIDQASGASRCFLEQETLHSLNSTGWFQERIRKCVYKLIASYTIKQNVRLYKPIDNEKNVYDRYRNYLYDKIIKDCPTLFKNYLYRYFQNDIYRNFPWSSGFLITFCVTLKKATYWGYFCWWASLSASPKACPEHNSVIISRIDAKLGMHASFNDLNDKNCYSALLNF
jgi:hypothetical protein